MKTIYAIAALAALMVGCAQKVAEPVTVNGTVIDATMNNIVLLTAQGDTIDLSTMDADPANVGGVLIDDSVMMVYKDTLVGDVAVKQALRLEVLRHSPYFFIQGSWVEPNPIKESEVQGFTLNPDGTVTMINMATLAYEAWNLADGVLTLIRQSIGTKLTIAINDAYKVDQLDADKLVLSSNGQVVFNLTRQK